MIGNDELLEVLRLRLSKKRLQHSKNVADEAQRLAEKYGADPEKAYMLKYVYSYADHIAKYEVNNDYSLAKWEMAAYKSANPMQAIIDHAREYYNPDKEN